LKYGRSRERMRKSRLEMERKVIQRENKKGKIVIRWKRKVM
jgi:hypothetical protein